MSFAKVTLIGNLGRDPEVRYTPDGRALASTSIAVTRKTKNGEETDWYRVTFGGKLGEIAGQYLKKGRQVYVEGRLKLNKYTDRDGNERHSLDVDATEMQMIGSRDGGEGGGGGGGFGGARESGGGGYSREPAGGGGGGYGRESGGGARSGGGAGAARPAGGSGSRPAPEPSFGDDDDIPF